MALTFTLGPPCAGGDHFDVTITLGVRGRTIRASFTQMREVLSQEEENQFAELFMRYLVSTHASATRTAIKNKLANASVKVDL